MDASSLHENKGYPQSIGLCITYATKHEDSSLLYMVQCLSPDSSQSHRALTTGSEGFSSYTRPLSVLDEVYQLQGPQSSLHWNQNSFLTVGLLRQGLMLHAR